VCLLSGSHKRRDKRCHLAASVLADEFVRVCAELGWDVDERGDFDYDPAEEDVDSAEQGHEATAREAEYREKLRGIDTSQGGGRIGLFKVSHVGGHKFAGNVIVCLPSGASVWYGRVTAREVEAIVRYVSLPCWRV
jgi:hypothetical protein